MTLRRCSRFDDGTSVSGCGRAQGWVSEKLRCHALTMRIVHRFCGCHHAEGGRTSSATSPRLPNNSNVLRLAARDPFVACVFRALIRGSRPWNAVKPHPGGENEQKLNERSTASASCSRCERSSPSIAGRQLQMTDLSDKLLGERNSPLTAASGAR